MSNFYNLSELFWHLPTLRLTGDAINVSNSLRTLLIIITLNGNQLNVYIALLNHSCTTIFMTYLKSRQSETFDFHKSNRITISGINVLISFCCRSFYLSSYSTD